MISPTIILFKLATPVITAIIGGSYGRALCSPAINIGDGIVMAASVTIFGLVGLCVGLIIDLIVY